MKALVSLRITTPGVCCAHTTARELSRSDRNRNDDRAPILYRHRTARLTSAIIAVRMSVIARAPNRIIAPVIAPVAAPGAVLLSGNFISGEIVLQHHALFSQAQEDRPSRF